MYYLLNGGIWPHATVAAGAAVCKSVVSRLMLGLVSKGKRM